MKVKAIRMFMHEQETVRRGQVLDVSQDQAKEYAERGFIEPMEKKAAKKDADA